MTKDKAYKVNLARAVRAAIHSHIIGTPEKELVVTDFDPLTGNLTIWVDGIYRVTIENMIDLALKKKAS